MAIEIGYDLPFAARVLLSRDDLLRIRVRAKPTPTEEDLRRVWAHVEVFVHAALLGMGVGAKVPPRMIPWPFDIEQHIFAQPGFPGPDSISFEAKGVLLEAEYVVVFLHKMYALDQIVPIAEVVVEVPRAVEDDRKLRVVKAPVSVFPGHHAVLPFHYDDSGIRTAGEHVTLSMAFSRALAEPELKLLREGLDVWIAQAAQGGYISPSLERDTFFLAPADDLLVMDNEIQWDIDKFFVDVRGLDAVVNFLVAYHHQIVPLHEVVFD
jgi:hypothetical protein